MKKIKFNHYTLLIIFTVVFILYNFMNITNAKNLSKIYKIQSSYQTEHANTYIYNLLGNITYKFITDKIYFCSEKNNILFINPILIVFDKNQSPILHISNNKAKLTKENKIFFYGIIKLNTLEKSNNLKQIVTKNAILNLSTNELSSNNIVTIYGINFKSTGKKIKCNIQNKIIEITGNIKSHYEIYDK